jgi:predicted metal-binding protein
MTLEGDLKELFKQYKISFLKTVEPKDIIFDKRAFYMCKYGCENYNRNYSCPPFTINNIKELNSEKFNKVLLIATSYDIPKFSPKFLVWVFNTLREMNIQKIATKLNEIFFKYNFKYQVVSGGPCNKCFSCTAINGSSCKKPLLKQISMEASIIDCIRTMTNAGYEFEMPNIRSINRCTAVFIIDSNLDLFLKSRESPQNFNQTKKSDLEIMCKNLLKEQLFEEIKIMKVSDIQNDSEIKTNNKQPNYSNPPYSDQIPLNLWDNALLWKLYEGNNYNLALKTIHSAAFSLGYYFSLSIRDNTCDYCNTCKIPNVCPSRTILAPSMASQGIDKAQFGPGRSGIELLD